MVVSELKALARKLNISLPARAKKADIVEWLASAFKQKTPKSSVIKSENASSGIKKSVGSKQTAETKKNGVPKKNAGVKKQITVKKPLPKPAGKAPVSGEWKLPPGTEEPLMAQERVSDAKYYTGHEQEQRSKNVPYMDLPLGYGEEKIALMVRDPHLAYVYWEVTPSRIEREKAWFGWNGKLAVRVYDVTGVQFDGRNAIGYFDQEVKELIGNWYFDLGRPTHSFIADIGLLSPEGRFLTLARSNFVMMPRDGVSDVVDEEWMLVDEEFWKLYGFPGGPSSPQLQEMMKRRMRQITSSGSFSRSRRK